MIKSLTLAQAFVDEKSNEITAIPKLLKTLNLEGAVVSLDAMGTQRGNASDIVEAGADYVLCVKENQGDLHKELIDQFEFAARQLGLDGSQDSEYLASPCVHRFGITPSAFKER